ncbi:MAG: DUF3048 domain-containing protein [Bacillota bacterium]|nr:DUF3048 domain-containing protein [Bacillota bacterium]
MKKFKRKFPLTIIMAMAFVLAMGTVVLTGCGDTASAPEEPEPIINPITGIESDEELPARPVVVSIPNAPDGAVPQSNISYADIIYEFPVEGMLTRLQAVYFTEFPEKFGPIRSVRYYFVDLAREYKAAHVGYGWGKKAKGYMEECGIPHINGMQDTDLFYRVEDKAAPNDAYIDWSSIQERADSEGWFDQPQKIKPFKFRDKEWKAEQKAAKAEAEEIIAQKGDSKAQEDIDAVAEAEAVLAEPEKATSVKVSSIGCNSECRYNEETKLYDRYWYGEPYVDKETGEQLSFSNIIVQYVHSDRMVDSETGLLDEKGRLEIDMAAGGDALLFTKGEVVKGKWSRRDLDSRTIFKDENGKQFRLTPGKTWVYVVDQNLDCTYE